MITRLLDRLARWWLGRYIVRVEAEDGTDIIRANDPRGAGVRVFLNGAEVTNAYAVCPSQGWVDRFTDPIEIAHERLYGDVVVQQVCDWPLDSPPASPYVHAELTAAPAG